MARKGCCSRLRLREDNTRFVLLAIVMIIYMLIGAVIFMLLEQENEKNQRKEYYDYYNGFKEKYKDVLNITELDDLLYRYSEARTVGLTDGKRERWDFAGSFYFVGTVVSTIGFGMTTPQTLPGKIVLVFYGFLGCAGAILFFNLFLERIITFLAFILRMIHERDLRRKGLLAERDENGRRGSDDNLDSWKPSVYWVMLILLLGALVIACCASALYHPVEKWTYFEAMYFCFVAFATIGFGDYVVSQENDYAGTNVHFYRFGNFIFIVLGCCCIYSLFNVISIVIKQFLNWMIRKLDCQACHPRPKARPRRNAITPGHLQRTNKSGSDLTDVDSNYDSDNNSRRGSGEMISMRDFLANNKISLLMMQKQLYDTSRQGQAQQNGSGFQGGVGPLAILNRKLGQDEV